MKILAAIFLLSPTNTEQFQIKWAGMVCSYRLLKYYACIKGIESLIEWPIFVRNDLKFAIILQFLTHKEMYDETKPAKLCTLLHRKPVQWLGIYLHCTVHFVLTFQRVLMRFIAYYTDMIIPKTVSTAKKADHYNR